MLSFLSEHYYNSINCFFSFTFIIIHTFCNSAVILFHFANMKQFLIMISIEWTPHITHSNIGNKVLYDKCPLMLAKFLKIEIAKKRPFETFYPRMKGWQTPRLFFQLFLLDFVKKIIIPTFVAKIQTSTMTGNFHSWNKQNWLSYQILGGKTTKYVQIYPQTT